MQWVRPLILAIVLQLLPVGWVMPHAAPMPRGGDVPVDCESCECCPCTLAEIAACCPDCPLTKTTRNDGNRAVAPKRDSVVIGVDRHAGEPSYPSFRVVTTMPLRQQACGTALASVLPELRAFIGVWVI